MLLKLLVGSVAVAGTCLCQPPVVRCNTATSQYRSKIIRSKSLQAFTLTEAQIFGKWGCANTARLYIAAKDQPFRVVYSMAPLRSDDTGDSLQPIAWSPDGNLLAIEALYRPQTGSDAAAFGLLLYDARNGHTEEVNSDFSSDVSRAEHRVCEVVLRSVQGFSDSGKVILELADAVDEEQHSHACIGKESKWLFDPGTRHIVSASAPARR